MPSCGVLFSETIRSESTYQLTTRGVAIGLHIKHFQA